VDVREEILMNYQKPIQQSYIVQGVGYTVAASGIAALLYGLIENNALGLNVGIGNILSGAEIVWMGKTVRTSAEEAQEILPSPLEMKVQSIE